MTEPDTLGPCEPGTAVKLSGIVWQETDKGGKFSKWSDSYKFLFRFIMMIIEKN